MTCDNCGSPCQGQYCNQCEVFEKPGLGCCKGCKMPIAPERDYCGECREERAETDGGRIQSSVDQCGQCGGVFVLDQDSLASESVCFECSTPTCDAERVVDRETARRNIGAEKLEALQ